MMIQDARVVSLKRVDVRWELYVQNIVKHHFKEMRMFLAYEGPAASFIFRFSYSLCKIKVDVKQNQPEVLLH